MCVVAEPLCCTAEMNINTIIQPDLKVKGGGTQRLQPGSRGHSSEGPCPAPSASAFPLCPQDTGIRVLAGNSRVGYSGGHFPLALGLGPARSTQAAADCQSPLLRCPLGSSGQGHLGSML